MRKDGKAGAGGICGIQAESFCCRWVWGRFLHPYGRIMRYVDGSERKCLENRISKHLTKDTLRVQLLIQSDGDGFHKGPLLS